MVPSWPPLDSELVPVIEDSIHFFYIRDFLDYFSNSDYEIHSNTLRLVFFNFAEAWVFAFLPLLIIDKERLPLPVVLGTWLGALGLTNAFLAPYLAFRGGFSLIFDNSEDTADSSDLNKKNTFLSTIFGGIACTVVGFAFFQSVLVTSSHPEQWSELVNLIVTDRTYMAFAVDLVLFSVTQSYLLRQVSKEHQILYDVPFIGLIAWLFTG